MLIREPGRVALAAGLLLLADLLLLLLVGNLSMLSSTHARPNASDAKLVTTKFQSLYVAGYSRPHPELCPLLGARTRLVILVASAPANAAAREAVRLTWGNAALRTDVVLAFVLGAPQPSLRAALDAEDALYGDLVEGRFVDSYNNLTLKTISMLEWLVTYCPRAPRVLKTDDDVFINVPKLLKFAEDPARRNATNTVWGRVIKSARPVRDPRHKHYLPLEEFPVKMYPDYVEGPAYLVTADAARRLVRAAPGERYVRMEDVFVTGVLAARLGVRRVMQVSEFLTGYRRHPDPCNLPNIIAIHTVEYDEQFDLWHKLNGKTLCAPTLTGYVYRKVAVLPLR